MLVFKGQTFAQAYQQSLRSIMVSGSENTARGTVSREYLDACLVIDDPASCLYTNQVRGSQLKYIAAEFLWYFTGRNDVQYISKHAKFWESIQNPDGTANSAYGNLIFNTKNHAGFTQYQWAIDALKADKNTRQAIMHFNLPIHQYSENKDFVCTMYANFHIRDNKLHLSVFMRSNDAIWGTPTDVAFFCALQMQALSHLRVTYPDLELGKYSHTANSYHVYDRHYDLVNQMLKHSFDPMSLPPVKTNLIKPEGYPTIDLLTLCQTVDSPSDDTILIIQDQYDLLAWIFQNYDNKKQNA